MRIDITPWAFNHLYKDYNPALELHKPSIDVDFINWVKSQYNGNIKQDSSFELEFYQGWSIEFNDFIDLLVFCQRYEL